MFSLPSSSSDLKVPNSSTQAKVAAQLVKMSQLLRIIKECITIAARLQTNLVTHYLVRYQSLTELSS